MMMQYLDTSHLEHNSLETKWNVRANFSYSEASKGGSPYHQVNGVLSPPTTKRADVIRAFGDRISPTKDLPKRGKSSLIPKPQLSASLGLGNEARASLHIVIEEPCSRVLQSTIISLSQQITTFTSPLPPPPPPSHLPPSTCTHTHTHMHTHTHTHTHTESNNKVQYAKKMAQGYLQSVGIGQYTPQQSGYVRDNTGLEEGKSRRWKKVDQDEFDFDV